MKRTLHAMAFKQCNMLRSSSILRNQLLSYHLFMYHYVSELCENIHSLRRVIGMASDIFPSSFTFHQYKSSSMWPFYSQEFRQWNVLFFSAWDFKRINWWSFSEKWRALHSSEEIAEIRYASGWMTPLAGITQGCTIREFERRNHVVSKPSEHKHWRFNKGSLVNQG